MRRRSGLGVLIGIMLAGCGGARSTELVVGETITTDSGLQVTLLEAGDGPCPEDGDTVRVDYVGMLEDGTMFDSSMQQGGPISVTLGDGLTIRGLDEGLAMLCVGDRAELVIPPALGYGDQGAPPLVPPGASLLLDVEIAGIDEAR